MALVQLSVSQAQYRGGHASDVSRGLQSMARCSQTGAAEQRGEYMAGQAPLRLRTPSPLLNPAAVRLAVPVQAWAGLMRRALRCRSRGSNPCLLRPPHTCRRPAHPAHLPLPTLWPTPHPSQQARVCDGRPRHRHHRDRPPRRCLDHRWAKGAHWVRVGCRRAAGRSAQSVCRPAVGAVGDAAARGGSGSGLAGAAWLACIAR